MLTASGCSAVGARLLSSATLIAALAAATGMAGEPAADPRVRPGATFTIPFPDFGKMYHKPDMPACVEIYIPLDWTPDRSCGLVCWFGGGAGTHKAGIPKGITGGRSYVCAGLPYRLALESNKNWRRDDVGWGTSWRHYKVALAEIERVVPNIDPGRRVAMGFSSGGAAVGCLIDETPEFTDYFYAFGVAGYGWWHSNGTRLKGRPVLLYGGENDSRTKGTDRDIAKYKSCGADPESIIYKNKGHTIAREYFPKMRDWLDRKVTYRGLSEAIAHMDKAMKAGKWPLALTSLRAALGIAEPNMKEYARAQEGLKTIAAEGEKALAALLAKNPAAASVRDFAAAWSPCACSESAREAADVLAGKEVERLGKLSSMQRYSKLRSFIEDWRGYPVRESALARLEEDAAKAFEAMAKRRATKRELRGFVDKWSPAPSTQRALAKLEELAAGQLDPILATRSTSSRKSRLKTFIRDYDGTPSAEKARAALNEILGVEAEKVLAKIKMLPRSRQKFMLASFIRSYDGTDAAKEAKKMLAALGGR